MKSLLLRRTKTELLDKGQLESLPSKELHLIEINLDKEEMNVYQKVCLINRKSKLLFYFLFYSRF